MVGRITQGSIKSLQSHVRISLGLESDLLETVTFDDHPKKYKVRFKREPEHKYSLPHSWGEVPVQYYAGLGYRKL